MPIQLLPLPALPLCRPCYSVLLLQTPPQTLLLLCRCVRAAGPAARAAAAAAAVPTLRTTRGSPADLSSATQRCCIACLKPTSDTSDGS
jgi:hypothetical protein